MHLRLSEQSKSGAGAMSNFMIIDTLDLCRVVGGEEPGTTTTNHQVDVKTPGGGGSVQTTTTTTEPSTYIRCLGLIASQAGAFESPANVERRQDRLCGPLRGQ
jgi:hypothetical protein